jgi:hypothetical protein
MTPSDQGAPESRSPGARRHTQSSPAARPLDDRMQAGHDHNYVGTAWLTISVVAASQSAPGARVKLYATPPVQPGVIDTWRRHAIRVKRSDDLEQSPADAYDHRVRRTQVLDGAIQNCRLSLLDGAAAQHPCLRLPSINTNALPHASLGMWQGVTVSGVTGLVSSPRRGSNTLCGATRSGDRPGSGPGW